MKLLLIAFSLCASTVLAVEAEKATICPPCRSCPKPFIPDCPLTPCPIVDCPFNPCPDISCAPCPELVCAKPRAVTCSVLDLVQLTPKIDIDYTPRWGRGRPQNYIDNVTFPKVLRDKVYKYRVQKGSQGLGVRAANAVAPDGSQRINFLEWNSGYGIADTTTIKVFAVDPDSGTEHLVAQWR
jgi:hypothetical protein